MDEHDQNGIFMRMNRGEREEDALLIILNSSNGIDHLHIWPIDRFRTNPNMFRNGILNGKEISEDVLLAVSKSLGKVDR